MRQAGQPPAIGHAALRDATGRQEVNNGSCPQDFSPSILRITRSTAVRSRVQNRRGAERSVHAVDPTIAAGQDATFVIAADDRYGAYWRAGTSRQADRCPCGRSPHTSLYVPGNDRDLVQRIVRFLGTQDYVGGIFVNDRFGQMPGALPMSDVGLVGARPRRSRRLSISFKSFRTRFRKIRS